MMKHLSEGFEVAHQIKSDDKTKDIPIIMLTAVGKQYDYTTQFPFDYSRSDLHIEKPIDPDTLKQEVRTILEN